MKKFILTSGWLLFAVFSFTQTIHQKLQKAFQQFESDAQLKHGISSLFVMDARTGRDRRKPPVDRRSLAKHFHPEETTLGLEDDRVTMERCWDAMAVHAVWDIH